LVGLTGVAIYGRHSDNTWTSFMEWAFPYPAAMVGTTAIPLDRFRLEVSARENYNQRNKVPGTRAEVEQRSITLLADRTLYAQALSERNITVTEADIDTFLDGIYQEIGGPDKLARFLSENYGPDVGIAQFRVWTRELLVESAVKHQLLRHVQVRHILISVPEGATEAQVDQAKAKLTETKAKITNADTFTAQAKAQSEDVASREKGGDLGTTLRGEVAERFSKEFETAIFSLPVGQVSDPIRSKLGWHLVMVDKQEGEIDKSLAEFSQELRDSTKVAVFIGN
jgi:peptidyl-prolyl cis-trans isomerase C